MFQIEETDFGYRMTFEGFIQRQEMADWTTTLRKRLKSRDGWGNFVDMRGAAALPADTVDELFNGIEYCRTMGMERVAVIVSNPISMIQAVRVCKESGIYDVVRFIDASNDARWEQSAMNWIERAVAPN